MAERTQGEVSYSALSRIESGARYPTLHTLEALAWALDASFTITPAGTELRMLLEL